VVDWISEWKRVSFWLSFVAASLCFNGASFAKEDAGLASLDHFLG